MKQEEEEEEHPNTISNLYPVNKKQIIITHTYYI